MAVAASDLALVHLAQETCTSARMLYPSDGIQLELRIHVVEVEHDRVGFPAVDAGMIRKKGIDDGPVS